MNLSSLLHSLHLLAALVWVGGMFFAWMILRPAAALRLQPAQRLPLWLEVLQRFFIWVWLAVLALPLSGIGLLHLRFAGFASMPRHVQIMLGLYLVMLALFLRARLLVLPQLQAAVAAEQWPLAGEALARIRRLVGINLLVGLLLVLIAALRPVF